MSNLLDTIAAKSDQLNADDLIGGQSKTIMITKVSKVSGEQPIAIHFQGDNGKPWKPCKSMRRVLVHVWGGDGSNYVGRSLTLYRDDDVVFGGAKVGGIRVSHMTDIKGAVTLALTATRANRKPYTVQPLVLGPTLADMIAEIEKAETLDELKAATSKASKSFGDADSRAFITRAKDRRKEELSAPPGDGSMFGNGKPEDSSAIKG